MFIGHFFHTLKTISGFHGNITPFTSFLPYIHHIPWLPWLHQLNICDVSTVTQQCKQSQTTTEQGWKLRIQPTILNRKHFKMVEAIGLKITASGSPWMASPPYQVSWKIYQTGQKLLVGDTQTNRLVIWWVYFDFWKVG
jgi:hypothetical protein